jgi:hypothetical protein
MHRSFPSLALAVVANLAPLGALAADAPVSPSDGAPYTMQWDVYSPSAIIAGTGCQKNVDAFGWTNGNDLAVVFTNLRPNLYESSAALVDRKSCTLRIPGELAKGFYPSQITQRFTYGVTKTPPAEQEVIALASTLFGFSIPPFTFVVPPATDSPLGERTDTFTPDSAWTAKWCAPNRSLAGYYQANVADTVRRSSRDDGNWLYGEGLDTKLEALVTLAACGD